MRITESRLRKIIREVIKETSEFDPTNPKTWPEIQDHIEDRLEDEHGCQIDTKMGVGGIVDVKRCTDDPDCENDVYILVHLEDEDGGAQGVVVYHNREENSQMIESGPWEDFNDAKADFVKKTKT
jgi:hypothetical protein